MMNKVIVGGLILIAVIWTIKATNVKPKPMAAPVAKVEVEKKPIEIWTPTETLICATNEKFIDSSHLVSPANFKIVKPGVLFIRTAGGNILFGGKTYWRLYADKKNSIFVYDDVFQSKFRLYNEDKK